MPDWDRTIRAMLDERREPRRRAIAVAYAKAFVRAGGHTLELKLATTNLAYLTCAATIGVALTREGVKVLGASGEPLLERGDA